MGPPPTEPDRPEPAAPRGRLDLRRPLLRLLGLCAAGLGLAGVFVPGLPTTVFLLVAAWAFARSSPRLHAWLVGHPHLGPMIRDWGERRAVPRSAKVAAVATMAVSWAVLYLVQPAPVLLVVAGACMAAVAAWLVTRPS